MMADSPQQTPGPGRFFDRDLQVETVKILPGQYHAARGEGYILGICAGEYRVAAQ